MFLDVSRVQLTARHGGIGTTAFSGTRPGPVFRGIPRHVAPHTDDIRDIFDVSLHEKMKGQKECRNDKALRDIMPYSSAIVRSRRVKKSEGEEEEKEEEGERTSVSSVRKVA